MKFAVYFALVFASSPALIQANDALSGDKDGYVKKKRRYLKSADGIVRRSPNVPSEDKTDSNHIRDDALTSGTETKQRVQDSGSRSGQGNMCEDPYIAYEFTEVYDCHPPYEHPCDDPEVFEDEWLVEFFGCLLPSSRTLKKDKNKNKEPKVESRCVNAYGWEDAWGDGCSDYADNNWCEDWANEMGRTASGEFLAASDACCVCKDSNSRSGPTDSGASIIEPPVVSQTVSFGFAAQEWVDAHNKRRLVYGKPPVSWNDDLAEQAKAWTDYLVTVHDCDLMHISSKCRTGVGENLVMNWCSSACSPYSPEKVCKAWTEDEIELVPTEGHKQAGHATQVLWKHSTHIGCATSSGACGHVSACRYNPPGNYNCDNQNCVKTIFEGSEQLYDAPIPSTSVVDECNQQNQPGYA